MITRRQFLRAVSNTGMALGAGGLYSLAEAKWCGVTRRTIFLPNLPSAFEGLTIALLSDLHHGRFAPLIYLEHVLKMAQALQPDVIALGGDYVHRGRRYIEPIWELLSTLRAPVARVAVLGNHDSWEGYKFSRAALQKSGITDLTNAGFWLERNGQRLRLCGVGDLWTDRIQLASALGDARPGDCCVLLEHNPDYAERLKDTRVSLMLCGHTHGGQIVLPFIGAPVLPSKFGQKYRYGLVQAPATQVFVTRGVGTITPPLRLNCPPEIALLTLRQGPVEDPLRKASA